MNYVVKLNKKSGDKRVAELEKIFAAAGHRVLDIDEAAEEKTIFFFEPRFEIRCEMFSAVPYGSYAFGYAKALPECAGAGIKYICLSEDEAFITENNMLTALALKQIIGDTKEKILIAGWGKLTAQIEKVFNGADISILDFNIHKRPELVAKYGEKAFFAAAPTEKFPIIINTIPKELLQAAKWKKRKGQIIYELASTPYGFDWAGCEVKWLDPEHTVADIDYLACSRQKTHFVRYRILPALPGKYYPAEAGRAVYNVIMRYLSSVKRPTVVLCITGSACSYLKLLPVLRGLTAEFDVIPVISENANQPNRFTNIEDFRRDLREITGHNIITNIAGAETLSANKNIRAAVIFPATGNTIAKLTNAITDTPVLMAVKAQLRNGKPCIIGISTNDALSGNARNIGELLNRKNIYFVPFGQDDIVNKPFSMICDFNLVGETVKRALEGQQLQPILI
jgi:dipicolinate synthase subunit B